MAPTEGNTATGTLTLSAVPGGVHITGSLSGVAAGGSHGFHVHETGDCSAPDAASAGGHFNPGGHPHGVRHRLGDDGLGQIGQQLAYLGGGVERVLLPAAEHAGALPAPVRFLLRGIGAMNRHGGALTSYLLFERPFTRTLIDLGYADTMARDTEVGDFLGL